MANPGAVDVEGEVARIRIMAFERHAICHVLVEPSVVPSLGQWEAVVLLGLGPTGLAFLAWDHATKHGRLPVLGALSYLAPLVSTLLLILTGQAEGSLMLIAAAALIIGGAVLATGLPARS